MSEPFATPIENTIPEPKEISPVTEATRLDTKTQVPYTLYSSVNNKTYTEKYFKLSDVSPLDIEEVENYMASRIIDGNLKDETATYDHLLEEIFNELGINPDEEELSKFTKLAKYIKMQSKLDLVKQVYEAKLKKLISKI
jgi:hypothetical protein